ncbi:CC0125/CC1285 family lipoprotein [Maricaulis sp.]|uniref:CC0125/CC1285 family lipoprotein n=1 Tax=Maricaulis sp. TaxID=1486257 RepID=UPI003A90BF80
MKRILPLLVLAPVLALTACATAGPTRYAPAHEGQYGYSERAIEQDRFMIRFDAGPDTSIEETEDLALRRAAEFTLEQGGDWFVVVRRNRDGNDRDPVRVGTSASYSTGSRGYSSRGIGVGIRIDGSAGQKSVTLEILVRTGTVSDDANAYDARNVLAHMP